MNFSDALEKMKIKEGQIWYNLRCYNLVIIKKVCNSEFATHIFFEGENCIKCSSEYFFPNDYVYVGEL